MNLAPVYELRDRLAASAIAGTGLISEDFRLSRAVEGMAPLAAASPVFGKIHALAKALVSPDCADRGGTLLTALALTDAVLTTQGAVSAGDPADLEPLDLLEGAAESNAPYSLLAPLLDALTGAGGGRYAVIKDTHDQSPGLFRDYRVKPALVAALSDSYSETADMVERWLSAGDRTLVPLLKRGLDPKGKKDMARRVRVIGRIAGAAENDYYIALLETSEKAVREEAILALRYEKGNAALLLSLAKAERGGCKRAAQQTLSHMGTPEVLAYWEKQLQKDPAGVAKFLRFSPEDSVSEQVASQFQAALDSILKDGAVVISEKEGARLRALFAMTPAKGSNGMQEVYRRAAREAQALSKLRSDKEVKEPTALFSPRYDMTRCSIEDVFPLLLTDSIVYSGDLRLCALAAELFQDFGNRWAAPALAAALLTEPAAAVYDRFAPLIKKEGMFRKEDEQQKAFRLSLFGVLGMAGYDEEEKRYLFCQWYRDELSEQSRSVFRPLFEAPDLRWFSLLTDGHLNKHGEIFCTGRHGGYGARGDHDRMLAGLIDPNDAEICRVCGEYFYKRALVTQDNTRYYAWISLCGWTGCQGLLANTVQKKGGSMRSWQLRSLLGQLPLSNEQKADELERVAAVMKQQRFSKTDLDEKRLADWAALLRAGKEF